MDCTTQAADVAVALQDGDRDAVVRRVRARSPGPRGQRRGSRPAMASLAGVIIGCSVERVALHSHPRHEVVDRREHVRRRGKPRRRARIAPMMLPANETEYPGRYWLTSAAFGLDAAVPRTTSQFVVTKSCSAMSTPRPIRARCRRAGTPGPACLARRRVGDLAGKALAQRPCVAPVEDRPGYAPQTNPQASPTMRQPR